MFESTPINKNGFKTVLLLALSFFLFYIIGYFKNNNTGRTL